MIFILISKIYPKKTVSETLCTYVSLLLSMLLSVSVVQQREMQTIGSKGMCTLASLQAIIHMIYGIKKE